MLTGGGIQINKVKTDDILANIGTTQLINNKYIIVKKGKKNYYLVIAS